MTAGIPSSEHKMQNAAARQRERSAARKKFWKEVARDRALYLILTPFLLYYVLFYYIPMFGLRIAFLDYNPLEGFGGSAWAGLKHFEEFFASPYAWRVIRNTFLLNVYEIGINFTATVILALLLNEVLNQKIRSAIQTILYMPHFISTVVVAGMVVSLLSPSTGMVNLVLDKLGMERVYFLAEAKYFRLIYTLMNGWQNIGFGTIVYTAAICGIDSRLYEAARMDGAGRLAQARFVTLPCIAGTIAVMLIMKIGTMLNASAEGVLLLYQPITYETADVISTYVYRAGMEHSNYSYSTAVGLLNGLASLALAAAANAISRRVSAAGLW